MTHLAESPTPQLGISSDRQVYDHIGALCRVIADGAMSGGAFSIVEERAQCGYMAPRHVHAREAETFLVLDGALEGWSGGTTQMVEAGNLIFLPAGVEHAFRVVSATAHFLTLITPAGFETFFEESGTPLSQDFSGELPAPYPLTPEQGAALQSILTPLGCTITGPPPFLLG